MPLNNVAASDLQRAVKTITFTGAAGLGAVGNVPLFTVTGRVLVALLSAYCSADLTEAVATATLALGVTNATALFIAATAALSIDNGFIWIDATPAEANGVAVPAGLKDIEITQNIVGTVATQAVNGGTLELVVWWLPLSANAAVVSA